MTRRLTFTLLLLSLLGLGGCASVKGPTDPQDPLEGYNRAMYKFNDAVDRAVLKPVAKGYVKVTPAPVRTGVNNFFSNLDDVVVLVNDLLQFKVKQAASDLGRLTFNSTVGLFGLIDVATPMNFPKHNEDFGQTLGYWGVGPGPYLVLPFLGPSDIRDTGGLVADWQIDPIQQIDDTNTRYGTVALKVIDKRANLLRASSVLESATFDPYAFMRDAYLQHRRNEVYDGNPPQPSFEEMMRESGPP